MKVEIIEGRCVGSGQCALNAPDVFGQDDDAGLVILLDPIPSAALHDVVREAELVCPTGAIRILRED